MLYFFLAIGNKSLLRKSRALPTVVREVFCCCFFVFLRSVHFLEFFVKTDLHLRNKRDCLILYFVCFNRRGGPYRHTIKILSAAMVDVLSFIPVLTEWLNGRAHRKGYMTLTTEKINWWYGHGLGLVKISTQSYTVVKSVYFHFLKCLFTHK